MEVIEEKLFPGGINIVLRVGLVCEDLSDGCEHFGLVEKVFAVAVVLFLICVGGVAASVEF